MNDISYSSFEEKSAYTSITEILVVYLHEIENKCLLPRAGKLENYLLTNIIHLNMLRQYTARVIVSVDKQTHQNYR